MSDHERPDAAARRALQDRIYDQLRGIAAGYLARERVGHTLQPTALVHEAYLRVAAADGDEVTNDPHFRASAARAMRQLLIEHARKRGAQKRGGARRQVTLMTELAADSREVDVLVLEESLAKLATLDKRMARVVELRFYGSLTIEECAEELGIAATVVKDHWRTARALLVDLLGDPS